jgi:hypothetical protein
MQNVGIDHGLVSLAGCAFCYQPRTLSLELSDMRGLMRGNHV